MFYKHNIFIVGYQKCVLQWIFLGPNDIICFKNNEIFCCRTQFFKLCLRRADHGSLNLFDRVGVCVCLLGRLGAMFPWQGGSLEKNGFISKNCLNLYPWRPRSERSFEYFINVVFLQKKSYDIKIHFLDRKYTQEGIEEKLAQRICWRVIWKKILKVV